jgi:ornithine decarboxylase
MGSGFDCASGRELQGVAQLGFTPKDIQQKVIYANPCKPKRDLDTASKLGSPTTVVDSFEEVDKLQEHKYKGKTLFRILVEDKNSLMPFSRKFGLPFHQVKDLCLYAKKKGIEVDGVSFHVGSACKDKQQYKKAIDTAHMCIATMRSTGFQPSLVDIGGGFVKGEGSSPFFRESASVIRANLPKDPYLRYIAEPGRFFSTDAFDLFVQVIGKKPGLNGSGWRYTVDESLYGQFSSICFDQQSPLWVRIPTKENEASRKFGSGTLFGRTCDSLDLIAKSPSMEELEVGDWLWFPNMGAYTSVTASEFNGFPKPPVLHLESKGVSLPSFDDLKLQGLRQRLPFDVTTVSGVVLGSNTIPAVA